MEETTASRFGPGAVLAVLGLAFVVAAIWAAAAFASGGTSSGTVGTSAPSEAGRRRASPGLPGAATAPSRDDCPGHDGGSGGDTAPSDGSSSSGNALSAPRGPALDAPGHVHSAPVSGAGPFRGS